MTTVVAISGSPSHPSRSYALLEEARNLLTSTDLTWDVLSIRDLSAVALLQAQFDHPDIVQASTRVQEADAVIIAAPVYKAAYPGILKAFLDLLPQKGLAGKPILPIVTGGTLAHLLAIDYAFKPVLGALGATDIRTGVYLVDSQYQRRETEGVEFIDTELAERFKTTLLDFAQSLRVPHPSLTAA